MNDRHGHRAGDRLLRTIGRTLAANVRLSDLVGRWGGDEFVVVLGGVDRTALGVGADKLVRLVGRSQASAGSSSIRATVSAGAAIALPEDTVESLVGRCDEVMYVSKRSGGVRVTVEESPGGADGTLPVVRQSECASRSKGRPSELELPAPQ